VKLLELYRRGRCVEADTLFQEFLKAQPRNTSIRKLYGSCLLQQQRTEEARTQYKAVLQISPGDLEAAEALNPTATRVTQPMPKGTAERSPERMRAGPDLDEAERLIQAKRLEEAERLLERILSRLPDAITPRERLAEIYSSTRRHSQAAAAYRALAAVSGQDQYRLREAHNLAWAKNYPDAVTAYRAYLKGRPADAAALLALANTLSWSGQLEDSIDAFREYLKLRPRDIDAQMSLGNSLVWNGRYGEALANLESAKAARPKDTKVLLALARCYAELSRLDDAIALYDEALRIVPADAEVMQAKSRLQSELPLKAGYKALEEKQYVTAARQFAEYLRVHPENADAMLRVARAYSWGRRFSDAARYYADYLRLKPDDAGARREYAKVQISIPDLAGARETIETLVRTGKATSEDELDLVRALLWAGETDAARPLATKLAQQDAANPAIVEALAELKERERSAVLEQARSLTAQAKYREAIAAYREYMQRFPEDSEAELAVARLHAWDKRVNEADALYRRYLNRRPDDVEARLELANLQKWSSRYDEAQVQYNTILRADARNAEARLGLAQVLDYSGGDPFDLVKRYRRVLDVDPNNAPARSRYLELAPLVFPSVGASYRGFGDSDGFHRSLNRLEAVFPFSGGLRVAPFYEIGYFHQYRRVGGQYCAVTPEEQAPAIAELDSSICARNGTFYGNTGGLRYELTPGSKHLISGEIGATRFTTGRTSMTFRNEIVYRPGGDKAFGIAIGYRDAIYDVNTAGSLAAGITAGSVTLNYQQPLSKRWRLWASGGASRYSAGDDRLYGNSVQRRFSTRIDYQVLPNLSAAYSVRVSSFSKPSEFYFSPSRYLTYGFAYAWSNKISKTLSITTEGELGWGRIKRFYVPAVSTLELAAYPVLVWQVRPDLAFRFGYRYSRGRSSTFGAPVYSTGGADFGISRSFIQPVQTLDLNRLEIR
jgi:tetratricopeptide (TPR) repeat protein